VATSNRPRMAIAALVVGGVILLLLVMIWPDKRMVSRDIGCANVSSERGKEICQALSDSMEWTWMGHAIISPGWRVTWKSLRRVYCQEKPSAADLAVLERLKQGSDWRLQDGADGLLRLVRSDSDPTYESENTIFNPTNAQYILKGGCKGDQ